MSTDTSNPNGLCPSKMSPDARLSELGRIVAAGVLRMREQSSSLSAASGDSSLAILPTRSVSRPRAKARNGGQRSEEHTSELQSLMRISSADFCLKKNKRHT